MKIWCTLHKEIRELESTALLQATSANLASISDSHSNIAFPSSALTNGSLSHALLLKESVTLSFLSVY